MHHCKFFAALYAAVVQSTFEGNLCHLRTVYRILHRMEGHRWPALLEQIDQANISVLIIAGSWECDPALAVLQHARRVHKALPKSTLEVMPRYTHMTWATGSAPC